MKEINRGMLLNQLLLWELALNPPRGMLGDSVEHSSELFWLRDYDPGATNHQLPIHHWLRGAFIAINSPEFPIMRKKACTCKGSSVSNKQTSNEE